MRLPSVDRPRQVLLGLLLLGMMSGAPSSGAFGGAQTGLAALGPAAFLPDAVDTPPSWSAEGNQAYGEFGRSIASAGDVNRDGFEDLVVGSDNGVTLYLGSPSGLATSPSWSFSGGFRFGASVSGAGDVNGDGFDDVIVGDPFDDRAYLFLGSPTGLGTAPASTISMTCCYDFGASVSKAGDVNGDGFGDVVIGQPSYANGESYEGRVLVYLGSSGGLVNTPAWSIEGNQSYLNLGTIVAEAGDLNGDGFGDVVVGGTVSIQAPNVFVYLGSPQGLSPTPAWSVDSGSHGGSRIPVYASAAGDVNGDGFGDLIVSLRGDIAVYAGGPGGPSTTALSTVSLGGIAVHAARDLNGDGFGDVLVGTPSIGGETRVYLGSSSGLNPSPAWVSSSSQSAAMYGFSLAVVDARGAGKHDVVVGAPSFSDPESSEGAVFLYSGAGGTVCVDADEDGYGAPGNLTCPRGDAQDCDDQNPMVHPGASEICNRVDDDCNGLIDEGFRVGSSCSFGLGACASFGQFVCTADGGALCNAPPAGSPSNETCDGLDNDCDGVVDDHLSQSCPAVPLNGAPTWQAEANQAGAHFGGAVASAGDVNGDGFSDIIVGAPNYHTPGYASPSEGRAFVYLGSSSGPSTTPAWTSGGVKSHFGAAVSSAGDVNGDGFDDVIVGEPDPFFSLDPLSPPSYQGQVSVFLGSFSGLAGTPAMTIHDGNFAQFGAALASAGDVNGDGYGDVIVGAPQAMTFRGQAFLYLGSPSGLIASPAWVGTGVQSNARYGLSVAGAGDVNGDGFDDVVVGEPGYAPAGCTTGRAYVYFGSSQGLSATPGWIRQGDANCINFQTDSFGITVAPAGDGNGDGYSDIVIGGARFGSRLFLGSPAGPGATYSWSTSGTARAAGDVNGDHYDDVAVANADSVSVFLGSSAGLSVTPILTTTSDQAGASFGAAIAGAGDTDGDGKSNVVIGAPLYDDDGWVDQGAAFLLFGPRVFACVDADHDGYCAAGPSADCDDTKASTHPNATEVCNGVDDDCDGHVDDGNAEDSDLDGISNCIDNCPAAYNPDQADADGNGVGDACDDASFASTIFISFKSALGKGSGTVTWTTNAEVDVRSFNVVTFTSRGGRIQLNPTPIPCFECATGIGYAYSFIIPKHKSGANIFVEVVRTNGHVAQFGPATKK